ncbi:sortase-like acyltransferase [Sphaerochaeta pleomorpha str. Grapes]|uniref:Sortase-like acyltransferase n=1 Tax=Sphaerochaeta pleomorpha (strain ATCC BAA-1885 / DSM 22778 / Grapes) TaxID=158190 RepID=G8QUT4_SPHPG|nr:GNAT family N-acetyltransferase [Sphaerochaeta pleomorpha]AEV28110.1 sortase-like acyltransferase [Sphaerochaeta pleomorpha str. Grapes]
MSDNNTIRLVRDSDAQEILAIYAPYIKETAITFEYEIPSLSAFKHRIKEISTDYPYLVYLSDNKITGYAYAHRYRERMAYQWNAELSVYVHPLYLHQGIGKELYGTLIELVKLQNIKNVYGGVTIPNEGSEHLHTSFGFEKVGVYHKTGYKCGKWHDVMWYEKKIGPYSIEPKPFISITEIEKQTIEKTMLDYLQKAPSWRQ